MELSASNLTTFSRYPMDSPTQQVVNFNEVPVLSHVWLPDLEDYLYPWNDRSNVQNSTAMGSTRIENSFEIVTTANVQEDHEHSSAKGTISTENGINTKNLHNSTAKDILYDQIVRLEEFDGEVIQNYSNRPAEQSDSFASGITMEVIDSGKQITLNEGGNTEGKSKEISAVASGSKSQEDTSKSPKTSRKATDCRRRREKANEREKQRIVVLKNAMNVLKNAIPAAREKTKITKLEVLQLARDYINSLRSQLMDEPQGENAGCHFESTRLQS